MPSNRHVSEYAPVAPSSQRVRQPDDAPGAEWRRYSGDGGDSGHVATPPADASDTTAFHHANGVRPSSESDPPTATLLSNPNGSFVLRRGHAFSYAGLFLFTCVLYFRPYELFPTLASLKTLAFWTAMATLAVFFPSQFALEGNPTARPREVNIVMLFALTALLSIPLAISPGEAWDTFTDVFLKAVLIFIVIVNTVRTKRRLNGILFLAVAVSCLLSVEALRSYVSGTGVVEGYRATGTLGGIFGNPNDMAIHLVSVLPIMIALWFGTRNLIKKLVYGAVAAIIAVGVVVTFSRGAFLALAASAVVLIFKLTRHNRIFFVILLVVAAAAFVVFAPGEYTQRMATIFDRGSDNGSASQRWEILLRSLNIALHNPVFGVGMGNFHIVSIHELVSHNSYTQVAAEMGLTALTCYVLFMLTPLKRLRLIERETFTERRTSHFYYLAIGLQASLVAYMVSSFFGSVAYQWYVYYLVGYAVCLRRIYEAEIGREVGRLVETKVARAAGERGDDDGRGLSTGAGASQSVMP